jgi:transposase InsO family protein
MNTITQDMKYRHSLINFALKHGVSKASRKYNRARSYIYFWLKRYDGNIDSLACKSKRPHFHPNQHSPEEIKLIMDMRRRSPALGLVEFWFRLLNRGYARNIVSLYRVMRRMSLIQKPQLKPYISKPYTQMTYPGEKVQIDVKFVPSSCCPNRRNTRERFYQYTAIDEFSRLRFLMGFQEHSTYSSSVFLEAAVTFFSKHGINIQCVQTDNGLEFTNRFCSNPTDRLTLFQTTAASLGIHHKTIKPFTPRHNGKVERSHREDQKRFYDIHSFYDFQDYINQLKIYLYRSNKIPMRPLKYNSPITYLALHRVQLV